MERERKKYYRAKIYGKGINDYEGRVNNHGVILNSYSVWFRMLRRCYDPKTHQRQHFYVGCKVCDEWLYFSNFKKWYDENYGLYSIPEEESLELDKDLKAGNSSKLYSPETCIFLPKSVNGFLTNSQISNKHKHIGVNFDKYSGKWRATIRDFSTGKSVGMLRRNTEEEAVQDYIKARESQSIVVRGYLRTLGYPEDIIKLVK